MCLPGTYFLLAIEAFKSFLVLYCMTQLHSVHSLFMLENHRPRSPLVYEAAGPRTGTGVFNKGPVLGYPGVDPWYALQAASQSPAHQALDVPAARGGLADEWGPAVALARVAVQFAASADLSWQNLEVRGLERKK